MQKCNTRKIKTNKIRYNVGQKLYVIVLIRQK